MNGSLRNKKLKLFEKGKPKNLEDYPRCRQQSGSSLPLYICPTHWNNNTVKLTKVYNEKCGSKQKLDVRIRWTCYTLCWSYIWISHKISLYLPLDLLFVDNKTQSLTIQRNTIFKSYRSKRKTVWDNSSEHKPFCLVL